MITFCSLSKYAFLAPEFPKMKKHSLYKDLNTSFVSLSDLLKCLRQQKFVGNVHFKSGKYEAQITLARNNQLRAHENIRRNGKILTNRDILRHILREARQPNGVINVYRQPEKTAPILKRILPRLQKKFDSVRAEYSFANAQFTSFLPRIHKPKKSTGVRITAVGKKPALPRRSEPFARVPVGGRGGAAAAVPVEEKPSNSSRDKISDPRLDAAKRIPRPPGDLPEALRNPPQRILTDWEIVLNLMNEILGTVDKNLAEANLNFTWMFEKTRLEIGRQTSGSHTETIAFSYENGRIVAGQKMNPQLFADNVLRVLRGILRKLRANSKFKQVYLTINQEILALIYDRRHLYDKFSITAKVKEIAMN